jgi:hypothetical protein
MSEGIDRHAVLRERTKAYASRVIRLYSHLQKVHRLDDAAMAAMPSLFCALHSTLYAYGALRSWKRYAF